MPSGPTRLTHGTGPSRKLSNIACRHVTMVLSNSYWNVWRCGRSDTPSHVFIPRCRQPRTAHSRPEPRVPSVKDICISKNMRIRKRNILTALAIMHRSASQKSARSSRTIPREDFLRVGERLEAGRTVHRRRRQRLGRRRRDKGTGRAARGTAHAVTCTVIVLRDAHQPQPLSLAKLIIVLFSSSLWVRREAPSSVRCPVQRP